MSQLTPSLSFQDRIAELKDETEKQKVELTPEVKAYIQMHLDAVQKKMSKGEGVTEEDDMKFIDDVKMWVGMPEEWRGKCPSIETLKTNQEFIQHQKEAKKRHLSLYQWLDLIHMSEAYGHENQTPHEWIDDRFHFPGEKKIVADRLTLAGSRSLERLPEYLEVRGSLILSDCSSLRHLPKHLTVRGDIQATACTSLTRLSDSLSVHGNVNLLDCAALTNLPNNLNVKNLILKGCISLVDLPKNLRVRGLSLSGWKKLSSLPEGLNDFRDLSLDGCVSLTNLPEDLKVEENLILSHCISLHSLPNNLQIGGNLFLSRDLQPKVRKDVQRLKREGKIKGKIKYE